MRAVRLAGGAPTAVAPNGWFSGITINPNNSNEAWVVIGGLHVQHVWHTTNLNNGTTTTWTNIDGSSTTAVPLRSFSLRGQLDSDLRFAPTANLYAETVCATVPNYGPELTFTGICNPRGVLATSGTLSEAAPSMWRFTSPDTASTSARGASRTSSS